MFVGSVIVLMMKIIRSNKEGDTLCYNGHMYTKMSCQIHPPPQRCHCHLSCQIHQYSGCVEIIIIIITIIIIHKPEFPIVPDKLIIDGEWADSLAYN